MSFHSLQTIGIYYLLYAISNIIICFFKFYHNLDYTVKVLGGFQENIVYLFLPLLNLLKTYLWNKKFHISTPPF